MKATTLKRYRELLQVHVVPVIGSVRMTEVQPAAVQAVITAVLDARSPRTAVNTYRVLSEMLGEAVRWGVIATNPAPAIRPPRRRVPIFTCRIRRRVRRSWSAPEAVRSREQSS